MIFALVLFPIIFRCIKNRRFLHKFKYGDPDHINPDIALNEQTHLLPYDNSFEFPHERIKFGKRLGAGTFGIIYEGLANGILPNEEETVVAIKVVSKWPDNAVQHRAFNQKFCALASELKILIHIGQHLNITNLLGTVTYNIKNCRKKTYIKLFSYNDQ